MSIDVSAASHTTQAGLDWFRHHVMADTIGAGYGTAADVHSVAFSR